MTAQTEKRRRVAVIGAGIVGACTALEMARAGFNVTVIDASQPGGEQAASYGNGAFISPASIIPMSVPGLWRKVPAYLLDKAGPLTINWTSLPRLAPWLVRFLRAGWTEERLRRTVSSLDSLLHDGPDRHLALAQTVGAPSLIQRNGILYAYPNRAAYLSEAPFWALRRQAGLQWRELDAEALHAEEPALAPCYSFGVLVESGAQCLDPGAYVRAILAASGATMKQARVTGLAHEARSVIAVETEFGPVPTDIAVLTAGMGSAKIARTIGDNIPLEAERGYHVELPDPPIRLRRPVMPSDGKMANTMTAGGLRAAGQVELSSADAAPDWRRADILLQHLTRTYPALASVDQGKARRWQGNRPSTPDGLPVIGAASLSGLWYGFGHGHLGLNAAPHTAALLADLVLGRPTGIDIAPFSHKRFARAG
ncbi:NAD(P)/FAD-dependent oxidoreductase [Paracoccus aerius]|uniref:FAD-dependent oxidoreductase n=2 Tax=Paracoccus aerius TaxID=1915382 RepID=A0ABS1S9N0_9RHOB|nr:FAD-dependent oxidoreductase [Paracoccus aerius]MBL3674814.1 FAD-dependent oxidoreductase [Paracoccus aerius]GHG29534.1 dehydrogenase [Paracoccus aerius]